MDIVTTVHSLQLLKLVTLFVWHYSCYFPTKIIFNSQRNSFQGIVVTDGEQSFAVFTYNCNMLQWSGLYEHAVIGTNTGSGVEFPAFQNHQLSSLPQVTMVACANLNRGIQWSDVIYKIGDVSGDALQRSRAECVAIYLQDIEHFKEELPTGLPCPCSVFQANIERNFRRHDTDPSYTCFVQRFPSTTGSAQECCYSAESDSS